MPEWALEVLKEHRAEQERDRALFGANYADNDLIFCQPGGTTIRRTGWAHASWS